MKVILDTTNPKDIEDAKKLFGVFADISDEMLDKIQELNKEDMEDILHEVASCSHKDK